MPGLAPREPPVPSYARRGRHPLAPPPPYDVGRAIGQQSPAAVAAHARQAAAAEPPLTAQERAARAAAFARQAAAARAKFARETAERQRRQQALAARAVQENPIVAAHVAAAQAGNDARRQAAVAELARACGIFI